MLKRLKDAGLDSLPGGGAEIFSERTRAAAWEKKTVVDEWLRIHGEAHSLGMKTNCTMLYGHIETREERVDHLIRLREQQDETGGFLAFIPLAFHPLNTELAELPSTTGFDDLKTLAIARLMLDNIPHVKAFWIMLGLKVAQLATVFGVDDLDGTVVEERITHMAGATTPEALSKDDLVAHDRRDGTRAGRARHALPRRPHVHDEACAESGAQQTGGPERGTGRSSRFASIRDPLRTLLLALARDGRLLAGAAPRTSASQGSPAPPAEKPAGGREARGARLHVMGRVHQRRRLVLAGRHDLLDRAEPHRDEPDGRHGRHVHGLGDGQDRHERERRRPAAERLRRSRTVGSLEVHARGPHGRRRSSRQLTTRHAGLQRQRDDHDEGLGERDASARACGTVQQHVGPEDRRARASGSKVTLSVVISGHKYTFNGTISGK